MKYEFNDKFNIENVDDEIMKSKIFINSFGIRYEIKIWNLISNL